MSPDRYSLGRLTVLLLGFLVGMQLVQSSHPLVMAMLLAAGAACGIASAVGPLSGRFTSQRIADASLWARGIVLFGSVSVLVQGLAIADAGIAIYTAVLVIGTSATLVFILRDRTRAGCVAFWFLMAGYASMMLVLFSGPGSPSAIDVQYYLEDGTRDILSGESPYGGSIANPYSAEDSRQYFHSDLVEGDRILIGFPYLPAILVVDALGLIMGDVRYTHLVCLLGACALLRRLAHDATGRMLALLPIASPLSVKVLLFYWVEPVVILVLVLVAFAVHNRRRTLGGASVALLLITKQYLVAVLPFLYIVARRLGAGPVSVAVGVASALMAGFFIWNPGGFWNDVVAFQFKQPFRADSISLTTALWQGDASPPGWVTGLLPLVAGLTVSGLISLRSRSGATALMLSVGLGLLVTVLLSKQAFPNYYALVQVALVAAAVTWPSPESGSPAVVSSRVSSIDAPRRAPWRWSSPGHLQD